MAWQRELGGIGLGLQFVDEVFQRRRTRFIQLDLMGQQTGQRCLPVGGLRPHQTGTEKAVQGRVAHVLSAVVLDPLIEMTGSSGWIHRRFLWI
ncbi:hypothetical protein D3C75_1223860 [compost metagenome]